MKFIVILAIVVGAASSQLIDVPASVVQAVSGVGVQILLDNMNVDRKKFDSALATFKQANTTCNNQVAAAIVKCRACAKAKCDGKIKSCKPNDLEKFLGKTYEFFKDKVPDFFKKHFRRLGGGIYDGIKDVGKLITHKIPDFGKKLGQGIIDVHKGAFKGVVDVGKKLGQGIIDVHKGAFKGIVDFGEKVGKELGRTVDNALKGLKQLGGHIGSFGSRIARGVRRIFGKRRRASLSLKTYLRLRRGEPSCKNLKSAADCQVYFEPQYCSDCAITEEKVCPGYAAAKNVYKSVIQSVSWIGKIAKNEYQITKMSFNPAAILPTGNFRNVVVAMNMFGKSFQFTMTQPINPYVSNVAGPLVARKALEEFKKL